MLAAQPQGHIHFIPTYLESSYRKASRPPRDELRRPSGGRDISGRYCLSRTSRTGQYENRRKRPATLPVIIRLTPRRP